MTQKVKTIFKKCWQFAGHNIAKLFIILWCIVMSVFSKDYLCVYFQKQANSHIEPQKIELVLVFLAALILGIGEFRKKRWFTSLLLTLVVLWAVFYFYTLHFECLSCKYGG
ncbi:MAG: hypothetical protein IKL04_04755 [Lachnospiraceae bacterium]|nr:hypothetical protein [Lachnospiraceae bacterium]